MHGGCTMGMRAGSGRCGAAPSSTSSILPPPAGSLYSSCIATIATISAGLIPAGGWWVVVGTSGGLQSTVPSSKAVTTQDTLASTHSNAI